MLSRFFGRALFGVARIKSSTGTIAAASIATSGTGHNLLKAFFQADRNPENETPDVYMHCWYTKFGGAMPYKPAEDLAFSVMRFIQNSDSFINYYMYHEGTNFGRIVGGPFIATSYGYDAPLDEYGLLREPKWSHLRDLYKAIKQSEWALVSADPAVQSLGSNQEAHVFKAGSGCAAFLANYDTKYSIRVNFGKGNMTCRLGPSAFF